MAVVKITPTTTWRATTKSSKVTIPTRLKKELVNTVRSHTLMLRLPDTNPSQATTPAKWNQPSPNSPSLSQLKPTNQSSNVTAPASSTHRPAAPDSTTPPTLLAGATPTVWTTGSWETHGAPPGVNLDTCNSKLLLAPVSAASKWNLSSLSPTERKRTRSRTLHI